MFDLSWSHIAILLVIALLVLGPKELPNAIRTGAQLLRMGRKLAGEFRSGVDELVREAELDETRQQIKRAMSEGVENTIAKSVDPTGEIKAAVSVDPLAEIEAPRAETAREESIRDEAGAAIVEHHAPPAPAHSITPPAIVPPAEEASTAEAVGAPSAQLPEKGEERPGESEAPDAKKSASA
jgi:sec-independent protein translocase protein TatB